MRRSQGIAVLASLDSPASSGRRRPHARETVTPAMARRHLLSWRCSPDVRQRVGADLDLAAAYQWERTTSRIIAAGLLESALDGAQSTTRAPTRRRRLPACRGRSYPTHARGRR